MRSIEKHKKHLRKRLFFLVLFLEQQKNEQKRLFHELFLKKTSLHQAKGFEKVRR